MTVNNNTNMSNYALIIIIHKNLISFSFVIKVAIDYRILIFLGFNFV